MIEITAESVFYAPEPLSMSYQPGTHIIASLQAAGPALLTQHEGFRSVVDQLIHAYGLQKLGEVYHDFSPAGFTAVVCLSESHISIHTWPEHGLINLDIYLSNFQRNNDGTTAAIYQSIREYFGATISREQILIR